MKAHEARNKTNKAKLSNLNYQITKVLKQISIASRQGKNYIILDNPLVHLFDDDYQFFRGLGYNVVLPKREIRNNLLYTSYGLITW